MLVYSVLLNSVVCRCGGEKILRKWFDMWFLLCVWWVVV